MMEVADSPETSVLFYENTPLYIPDVIVKLRCISFMAQQPLVGQGLLIIETQIILRHTTLGRTPLDEGPARRGDLDLTTHKIHRR
jgi:hypothetical protein